MRLFGGKIGFVGSGIHSLSSQILSKSFRNWFENRTLRGTQKAKVLSSILWLFCFFMGATIVWQGLVGVVSKPNEETAQSKIKLIEILYCNN